MVETAADQLRFIEAIGTGGGGVLHPQSAAALTGNAIGDLAAVAGMIGAFPTALQPAV
jgi:hypothetical protein